LNFAISSSNFLSTSSNFSLEGERMTRSSAKARIQMLVRLGLEVSPGDGNAEGWTKSHTKEKIITNKSGERILPSKRPRETRKGRERRLPILSQEIFRV
jgi:hypothetical protein